MADEDITKGKKPRKRGTRMRVTHTRHVVYENLNRPSHAPTPDLDPVDGEFDECATPAMGKAIEAVGNPFAHPGGRNPVDRVSPPLTAGHQAPSTGDHGAGVDPMSVPGAREMAFRHPASSTAAGTTGLDMGTHTPFPLFTSRTNHDEFPADLRGVASGVPVAMSRLGADTASGLGSAPGNPVSRPLDHQSRGSATAPNGSHALSNPTSHAAPMAAKSNSELRADFKRMLFPGSGGRR